MSEMYEVRVERRAAGYLLTLISHPDGMPWLLSNELGSYFTWTRRGSERLSRRLIRRAQQRDARKAQAWSVTDDV